MALRAKPTEEENRRNQARLRGMLQSPGNETCADCASAASEWASVNLGVFICIRCSGIHRQLGTHISKVRSVRLDSWFPEQLETMETVGNLMGRQIYEATMKRSARRFDMSNDAAMMQFIRDKYEHKKWYRKLKKKKGKKEKQKKSKKSKKQKTPEPSSEEDSSELSSDPESAPRRAPIQPPAAVAADSSSSEDTTSSDEDDLFGSVSAPIGANTSEAVLNAELERLRKLPENCSCPNCAQEEPMGFRQVSVKFGTFVCSYCKAGHQAFSHRIKSIGMSTFTPQDVALASAQGNQSVRATWLGKMRRKDVLRKCPTPASRPEDWHAWIKAIYEDKQFYKSSSKPAKTSQKAVKKSEKAVRKKGKSSKRGEAVVKAQALEPDSSSSESSTEDFLSGGASSNAAVNKLADSEDLLSDNKPNGGLCNKPGSNMNLSAFFANTSVGDSDLSLIHISEPTRPY
eukprot:TRINITY_DN6146_c0_g2_i1.p1 TRINITY_DN6146_c0_g2~~TRINITY_DN6146_c0_g2_i1.p1  ORF type:complete len:458 (+),score=95.13 TRINITY_DN6146_c0_g2_i1:233-1606(+)